MVDLSFTEYLAQEARLRVVASVCKGNTIFSALTDEVAKSKPVWAKEHGQAIADLVVSRLYHMPILIEKIGEAAPIGWKHYVDSRPPLWKRLAARLRWSHKNESLDDFLDRQW